MYDQESWRDPTINISTKCLGRNIGISHPQSFHNPQSFHKTVKTTVPMFMKLHRTVLWLVLCVSVSVCRNVLTYRHFLLPLQQMAIENVVKKGDIAHNEQFLLLSQCFQLFFTFIYRDFLYLCLYVFKVVCCRFVVCGKGLKYKKESIEVKGIIACNYLLFPHCF